LVDVHILTIVCACQLGACFIHIISVNMTITISPPKDFPHQTRVRDGAKSMLVRPHQDGILWLTNNVNSQFCV